MKFRNDLIAVPFAWSVWVLYTSSQGGAAIGEASLPDALSGLYVRLASTGALLTAAVVAFVLGATNEPSLFLTDANFSLSALASEKATYPIVAVVPLTST